ncbi:MAG: sigma-70 family RNA polymerase sigma factor [Spirochaetales bacterium]|nr:sigma-70 family RNA polymerase sigma factor [Spirochaetales bacterium]
MTEVLNKEMFNYQIKSIYDFVYKVVRKYRFDEHTSKDIIQEIMIKVYYQKDKFHGNSRFNTWIWAIARNYCINYKKRLYDKNPLSLVLFEDKLENSLAETPELWLYKNELSQILVLLIKKLPEYLKNPLICFYYKNEKYKVIADKLKIPIGTIKSRINRAKKILYRELKDYTEETDLELTI